MEPQGASKLDMAIVNRRRGDTYHVTGIDVYGRRFRIVTDDIYDALCINLYKGSVWRVRDGKCKLLRRVTN